MKIDKYFLLILFSILSMNHYVKGIVIGSNTTLSRQPTAYFPASDTDNTMLGFALFDQGFCLEDLTTSCTLDSFYPVNGTQDLNGGTLYLKQQEDLNENFVLLTTGQVVGNGNSVIFPAISTQINLPVFGLTSTNCLLKGFQFSLPNTITSIDISHDDKYIAVGMQTSANPELLMYTFKEKVIVPTSLAPFGGKVGTTIHCVNWHPTQNYLAICRADKKLAVFEKTDTSFTKNAEISLGTLTPISCTWHPEYNYILVSTDDYRSALRSYFFTTETQELSLIVSKDIPQGLTVVPQSIRFSPSGNFLAVGLNKSAQESYVYLYSFADGSIELVASEIINDTIENISFDESETYLAVTSGSQTLIRVFKHDQATLQPQTTIPETRAGYVAHWNLSGYYLTIVGQDGNPLELLFAAPNYCHPLMPLFANKIFTPIIGYTPFHWAYDATKFIAGTVGKTLNYYHVVQKPFTLENCRLQIPASINFSCPINIKGNCVLSGSQENIQLILSQQASINILPNSSLILENIELANVHGSNIACADTTGSLILRQTTLLLDGNFTFSYGSLTIDRQSAINGKAKRFSYKSPNNISILENAQLSLGQDVTFLYDPVSGSPDLISFANSASTLYLSEAHLAVGTSGLRLIGGMLIANGTAYFDITPGSESYAIQIGNDQADGDFELYIMPVTKLICTSGCLIYKNVVEASYSSHILSVLRINPGVTFRYNTIRAVSGGFEFSSSSSRIPYSGAQIYGDITIF